MKYHETKEDTQILAGYSTVELAKLLDCSGSYIDQLRSGRRIASWDFYKKACIKLKKDKSI